MLISLQLYAEVFERPFIEASEAFYTTKAKQAIVNLDVRPILF